MIKKKKPDTKDEPSELITSETEDNSKNGDPKEKSKAELKSEKKARLKSRPLYIRILIQVMKTFLMRIPIVIIIILIIALIVPKVYLKTFRVEQMVTSMFNEMSNGKISLKVKAFDPFSGIIIEDLHIRNGKQFNYSTFVKIDKLVYNYSFFGIFIGNINFKEIGIYNPRIYLVEKKGVWNAAVLMKPSKKKEIVEEEKEEEVVEEESGEPSKEINLPISVKFFFNFILQDLRVYVNGQSFNAKMEGLTFKTKIDIPPFKTIPVGLDAVSLLKTMNIVLNPKEKMKVSFSSKEASAKPPLVLTWKTIFSNGGTPKFNSSFKFGMYKTPIRFKRVHLAPLSFMVSYDMFYNPKNDHLKLNHFGVKFKGKKWLYLQGDINDVTKVQQIDLRMKESNISLNALYPYFRKVTGIRSMKFAGNISLYPLTIKGTPTNMDIKGAVKIKNLYYKDPAAKARIPRFKFGYNVAMRGSKMKIKSKLSIPHIFYTLNGSKSGDNGFELKTDIIAYNNFGRVKLNNIGLRFYSPVKRKNVLKMTLSGNVNLKRVLKGNIKIRNFRFDQKPLAVMIPPSMKKSIAPLAILKKHVDMDLDLKFALGKKIKADLNLLLKVPDYELNDLKLKMNVVQDTKKKRVNLKKFYLGSKTWNLAVNASGRVDLKKAPMSDSDLKLSVKLHNPKMKKMFGTMKMAGLVELNTFVKGDLETGKAHGSIKIKNLNISDKKAMLTVSDMNMNFPFNYSFKIMSSGKSLITVDKSSLITNINFERKPNFTIKEIRSKHISRNYQMTYLKDFSAAMLFKNNVFRIENMKAYVLDGSLYAKQILFNLADMDKNNMEFKFIMDLTNVDIAKFDDSDPSKKTRDAELSLNANFTGQGLDISKELNIKGYINIFKIGEKFADNLMKGLSKTKGKSKLGGLGQAVLDNTMKVKGFNFNIDKGLVYTTVNLQKKALGIFISVKDEKIEFDRIPIQEYLRKVSKGE